MPKKNLVANGVAKADLEELFREAIRLRDAEKYPEAARLLRRLCEQKPHSAAVWAVLGDVNWRQEKLKEAIKCFRRATELAPESELASLGLFHTLWEMGLEKKAREEMDRFQKVAHSDEYATLHKELDGQVPDKPRKRTASKRT
jgi:predicted Zn-dependent protease